jgi:tetratricopeptide (TPR) repeat protein
MRCSDYTQAIQDLADGTLGPVRRAELQTHLDACDACRALAADLQKITAAAPSLESVAPPDHVWMQIAGRLRQEGRVVETRRAGGHTLALLAIAATLLLAIGGSLYILLPGGSAPEGPVASQSAGTQPSDTPGNAAGADAVQSIADDFAQAEKHYQSAIAKLEEAAKADNDAIDAETAAILSKNLQVIDTAIAESQAALKAEPQSAPARNHLFEALRQKVMVLQETVALMNEMRKGNSAGAAQIVGGSKS